MWLWLVLRFGNVIKLTKLANSKVIRTQKLTINIYKIFAHWHQLVNFISMVQPNMMTLNHIYYTDNVIRQQKSINQWKSYTFTNSRIGAGRKDIVICTRLWVSIESFVQNTYIGALMLAFVDDSLRIIAWEWSALFNVLGTQWPSLSLQLFGLKA